MPGWAAESPQSLPAGPRGYTPSTPPRTGGGGGGGGGGNENSITGRQERSTRLLIFLQSSSSCGSEPAGSLPNATGRGRGHGCLRITEKPDVYVSCWKTFTNVLLFCWKTGFFFGPPYQMNFLSCNEREGSKQGARTGTEAGAMSVQRADPHEQIYWICFILYVDC